MHNYWFDWVIICLIMALNLEAAGFICNRYRVLVSVIKLHL
jgi:hypothetical protein